MFALTLNAFYFFNKCILCHNIIEPMSFGLKQIVVKNRSRKRRPCKDDILTMEHLERYLNSQQTSKEGLHKRRSCCYKQHLNIFDIFKNVPASGKLPSELLNLWDDLGQRVRNRISGKIITSDRKGESRTIIDLKTPSS